MSSEDIGLVRSADGKCIFIQQQVNILLYGIGLVYVSVLLMQLGYEQWAVYWMLLLLFDGLSDSIYVCCVLIKWAQLLVLIEVVYDSLREFSCGLIGNILRLKFWIQCCKNLSLKILNEETRMIDSWWVVSKVFRKIGTCSLFRLESIKISYCRITYFSINLFVV